MKISKNYKSVWDVSQAKVGVFINERFLTKHKMLQCYKLGLCNLDKIIIEIFLFKYCSLFFSAQEVHNQRFHKLYMNYTGQKPAYAG